MEDQEFKLKNPSLLASNLMKGLNQVADGKLAKIAEMFIWLMVAEAPEAWDEFVEKTRYYLDGGIEIAQYQQTNAPAIAWLSLPRAFNYYKNIKNVWSPEKKVLYAIFEGFTNQDWKCMAAFVEVESV